MAKSKLSSSTIKVQEFTLVGGFKKGYDPEEVRDFLNQVAKYVAELERKLEGASSSSQSGDTTLLEAQIEQLSEENENLKREMERLKKENEELKKKGEKGGALKWEDIPEELLATEILKAAKETGDRMIKEKEEEAKKMLEGAKRELETIKSQIEVARKELERIEGEKSNILSKIEQIKESVRNEIRGIAKKVEQFASSI